LAVDDFASCSDIVFVNISAISITPTAQNIIQPAVSSMNKVIAVAAKEGIKTRTANQIVSAPAAAQGIFAFAAVQFIIASLTIQ